MAFPERVAAYDDNPDFLQYERLTREIHKLWDLEMDPDHRNDQISDISDESDVYWQWLTQDEADWVDCLSAYLNGYRDGTLADEEVRQAIEDNAPDNECKAAYFFGYEEGFEGKIRL